MKLIESKVEYMPQGEGLEGIYKQIEACTRVSYKSEDRIKEGSAKKFYDMLVKQKHYGGLEHGTIYLKCQRNYLYHDGEQVGEDTPLYWYIDNPYSKVWFTDEDVYVTTNMRVIKENDRFSDIENYLCEPTKFHELRYTFKLTTDRGILAEITRHRKFSFLVESTRYVNYGNNDMVFVIPSWVNLNPGEYEFVGGVVYGDGYIGKNLDDNWLWAMDTAQLTYEYLINTGHTPQEARAVLPMSLKTEICITGFASDFHYLLDLRLYGKTGKPHPDMVILMQKLKAEAEKNGIWKDIEQQPSAFFEI